MTEELADEKQACAVSDRKAGERVAQVMNSKVVQPRFFADPLKRFPHADRLSLTRVAGKTKSVAVDCLWVGRSVAA